MGLILPIVLTLKTISKHGCDEYMLSINTKISGLVPLLTLFIGACSVNPPYTFKPGEKTASLAMIDRTQVVMCKDSNFYNVKLAEGKKIAKIPAGERISIGAFMYYSGYQVSYSCYPFLSFIPSAGEKYIVHSAVISNKCMVELVREDNSRPTGVAFEESLGKRNCFKKE